MGIITISPNFAFGATRCTFIAFLIKLAFKPITIPTKSFSSTTPKEQHGRTKINMLSKINKLNQIIFWNQTSVWRTIFAAKSNKALPYCYKLKLKFESRAIKICTASLLRYYTKSTIILLCVGDISIEERYEYVAAQRKKL